MNLDHELVRALAQFGKQRGGIQRSITHETIGVPFFAARDALQWIEKIERPNVTLIAEALGITLGGASKAVAKLQAHGLVERYQLPENRKEVYFRLTEEGRLRLSQLRAALAAATEQDLSFVRTLPQAQKQAVFDFLTGYIAHFQATRRPPADEKEEEEQPCEKR